MGKRTIVPFGPQHPALPEPIHLDLELEDETVVRAVPSIGYVHRGLEKLAENHDYEQMTYIMERVCGICSFGHSYGYTSAVERLMDVEIPDRAKYLRAIFMELSRVHSHLLWLGLLADAFGFDSLFMHCWRIREKVLDVFEEITGARVIMSFCKIGGVRKDVSPEMLAKVARVCNEIEEEVRKTGFVFMKDSSIRNRMCGTGVLSREEVVDLSAVGPVARGSGVDNDARTVDPIYRSLGFEPILYDEGDCWSRCMVRVDEIVQSMDLIRTAIRNVPGGEFCTPVKGPVPEGDFAFRIEQPRGEAFYYVQGNGTKFLSRARVRTPTNINIPALVKTIQGCQLQDVTMLVLTIDPCISCTER